MATRPPTKTISLRFGRTPQWEVSDDEHIASFMEPATPRLEDLDEAIESALARPIDFVPIDQALAPGDSLVLAVDPELPAMAEVVAKAARWLCNNGSQPGNMRVVIAGQPSPLGGDLERAFDQTLHAQIPVEFHDPDDPNRVAYVAANDASEPIYMNRSLVDADVVLPITCARAASALDYWGAYSIFPLLSDRATRGRFYRLPNSRRNAAPDQRQGWADQAAWWVGLLAGLQVIPAGAGGVAAVLAGQLESLESTVQAQLAQTWRTEASPADLVVAVLDGNSSQQTWVTVARALHMATQLVVPGGTLVVCTQLDQSVGKGLSRLRDGHRSSESIAKRLAKESTDDALAAAVVLQATEDYHVYLVSELENESIESLGLGVIDSQSQLAHLIGQHDSCTILGSAQHRFLA